MNDLASLLNAAVTKRANLISSEHINAVRLFNGFFEGYPDVCLDLYGKTIVINQYQKVVDPTLGPTLVEWVTKSFSFVDCVIQKERFSATAQAKRGKILYGTEPCQKIAEEGVWYKLDLLMNHDASFYLDTKNLRKWLLKNSLGKSVLNTFAYTGSLGIAALAGGASKVTQLDKSARFLELAKQSQAINEIEPARMKIKVDDFFPAISHYKKANSGFDIVILDPPFFSTTNSGKVDLQNGFVTLINKIRPLINHNGKLICINNALFVSGAEVIQVIDTICQDRYISIDQIIDIDQSFIGYGDEPSKLLPADPTPFNHSTKIIILNITKKSQ